MQQRVNFHEQPVAVSLKMICSKINKNDYNLPLLLTNILLKHLTDTDIQKPKTTQHYLMELSCFPDTSILTYILHCQPITNQSTF